MATPKGGEPIAPGLISRVSAGLSFAFTGKTPAWFGPNEPLPPQAPDEVKGRPFDFPVGMNLQYQPKKEGSESGISFQTLRRMADPAQGGLDLLRLAIETRKDQMEAQKWTIRGKDGKDGGQRAKDLMLALRRPDLVHTFRQWQRMLINDLLVLDAPCVYFRPTSEGFSIPEPLDGSTIKILVDQNGRIPLPPNPAYQQVIKGLPAVDYSLEELLYFPRNLQTNRVYGCSPVEQVTNIINLALRRQTHLTGYYTAGNMPEQLIGVPDAWNSDQVQKFQEWFDGIQSDNPEGRRKAFFIPGGMHVHALKDPKLKDELDEWLARVICFCFSLSPQAFVKEMNRATAETAQESASMEGLEPMKLWFSDFMGDVLVRAWGVDDLEFAYIDEEITDPKTKMEVWTGYKGAAIVTADEVREKALGMDPLSDEQKEELRPPPPPMGLGGQPMGDPDTPGHPGPGTPQGADEGNGSASAPSLPPASPDKEQDTEKMIKDAAQQVVERIQKGNGIKPISHDRAATRSAGKRIKKAFQKYFKAQRIALSESVKKGAVIPHMAKMDRDEFISLWDSIEDQDQKEALAEELASIFEDLGVDASDVALYQIKDWIPTDANMDAILSQANERAIDYATTRAAELVGMKKDEEGNWITNPNDQWAIDNTTRDTIQDLVTQAEEKGWSNDELADAIMDSTAFDDARADMIARTEVAICDVQGNLEGYKATNVVSGKEWLLAQDEYCEECEALDGVVAPLDGEFPGGDPPLHPNCRCAVAPVLIDPEEMEAAARSEAITRASLKRVDEAMAKVVKITEARETATKNVTFRMDENGRIVGATIQEG